MRGLFYAVFLRLHRRAIDARRRSSVIRWESLDTLQGDVASDVEDTASFEDLIAEGEAMGRALATLHVEDVACLLLVVVQGFTAHEAAAVVGSTPAAMGKRVGRAKRRLLTVYQAQNTSAWAAMPEGRL